MSNTVGIIGLGLLGSALVDRLRMGDFSPHGFDIDSAAAERFATGGAISAADPQQVFSANTIVVLCLPNSRIVGQLLAGVRLREGTMVVDTTTGDPQEAVDHAKLVEAAGSQFIEANVAGSSVQVRDGQATLFIGANAPPDPNVDSVLDAISTRRYAVGPVGSASKFKLVHNLVLGLHRAVLAEGLEFAKGLGFRPQEVLDILRDTPAVSGVMATKGDKMVSSDYSPQATLSQHLKDVRLILKLAEQANITTPLSEQHRLLLEKAESLGWGKHDNSAVIEAYR